MSYCPEICQHGHPCTSHADRPPGEPIEHHANDLPDETLHAWTPGEPPDPGYVTDLGCMVIPTRFDERLGARVAVITIGPTDATRQ